MPRRHIAVSALALSALANQAFAGVNAIELNYSASYYQNSPSAPAAEHDCQVILIVYPDASATLTGAQVTLPDLSALTFDTSGGEFANRFFAPSIASALVTRPNGNYVFEAYDGPTTFGPYTLSQPYATAGYPPQIPAFTPATYSGLQGMNPSQPFTIEFNPFTPGPGANVLFGYLLILDDTNDTTAVFDYTTNTQSSYLVPANTLLPGRAYRMFLVFVNQTSNPINSVQHILSFNQFTLMFFSTSTCVADIDDGSGAGQPDGGVGIEDLLYYLYLFEDGSTAADIDDGSATGSPDGGVGIEDLLYYLGRFEAGC